MDDFTYRTPTTKNIEAVTSFLPFFKDGTEGDFYTTTDGAFDFTNKVWDFMNVLKKEGFVYGFDWGSWLDEAKIKKNVEFKNLAQDSDILTIQKMFTVIARINWCNMSAKGSIGLMKQMIDEGVILSMLERLEQIRHDMKARDMTS